ncbi:pentapeptide repeat-containing protein [Aeromonas schubertii]|uniref:Pentapeptide repeat-containing protein n=1 Tax=Aeromonas schubertii TaxID=652 RepID=A0A0S2SEP0_9GAMM|nr:pentapeptide repeat-containing protein [Aeromonas schubertii]ALP40168.1 pentapeptide repeat-containing protein [Aeromonas schubertii]
MHTPWEQGAFCLGLHFEGLELPESQHEKVEFEECRFIGCDLSGAQFRNCAFVNCEFVRCNLSMAAFPWSTLAEVTFSECKLVGIDWTRLTWAPYHKEFGLRFHHCLLHHASFFGLTLQRLVLEECGLHDADLRDADLTRACMRGSDFSRALFRRTRLGGADFGDATGYDIDVRENEVKGARFSRFEALALLESLGLELVE